MSQPDPEPTSRVTRWLSRAPGPVFVAYAIVAAFSVYFCMYAFRKPFSAFTFPETPFLWTNITLKTACVTGQIFGYLISKYLGSKYCSEVRADRRAIFLIGLILIAEAALLWFAVASDDWKPAAMFANGLPLGMVWGLVVRYLEGRRSTETLLAGLSCSFIIAGAATRDIGRDLIMRTWGVPQNWMPFATGGLFLIPLLISVWMLDRLPPPSAADIAERAPRQPMDRRQRWAFAAHFAGGLIALLIAYFFLTGYRDFRDNYAAELFKGLDLADEPAIFSHTEKWPLFGAIIAMAGLNWFRDHRAALIATFGVIIAGFAMIGVATYAYQEGQLSGFGWMAWVGVGMNLAYVPFGAVLFERMMAASRLPGTSVFAIQLADGVGYTGAILIQFYRDLVHGDIDRLTFFGPYSYAVSIVGIVLMAISAVMVIRRVRPANEEIELRTIDFPAPRKHLDRASS